MGNFTTDTDEKFFGAIGRLTISWAYLELYLDIVVLGVHGLSGDTRPPPRALSAKVRYVLDLLKKAVPDDDERRPHEAALDAISHESSTRHDIVHGFITEAIEESGEATFMRLIHGKDSMTARTVNVTTRSVLEAALRAEDLSKQLHRLPPLFFRAYTAKE